jgi:hypothetical protein
LTRSTCVFSVFSVVNAVAGSPYRVLASSLIPISRWLDFVDFDAAVAAEPAMPATARTTTMSRAMRLDTQRLP